MESFANDHIVPRQQEFFETLTQIWTVTRFDHRGTGLSQREVGRFSLEAFVSDVEAVARAVGWPGFALWGCGGSGPTAVAFAARHPDLVTHLILYGTTLRTADVIPASSMDSVVALARADWGRAAQLIADLGGRPTDRESQSGAESSRAWGRALEMACDGATAARIFAELRDSMDATRQAPRVKSPTIVLHRQKAPGFPFEGGRMLAASIPGATFVPLRGAVAHFALGDSDAVIRAVVRFAGLPGSAPRPAAQHLVSASETSARDAGVDAQPPTTAVVVVADIAGSTQLTERMGDAAFRARSRELDATLRAEVRANGGIVIDAKTLGDGILATFPSGAQAIGAALQFERAAAAVGLSLHVGVHAGDVIREADNVFGGAVNVAARVSALSAPGQVLVSDVVRGLARTSAGVAFDDLGEQEMKGISEPIRVYRVRAI
jgi:class 3 adenylate cyclase